MREANIRHVVLMFCARTGWAEACEGVFSTPHVQDATLQVPYDDSFLHRRHLSCQQVFKSGTTPLGCITASHQCIGCRTVVWMCVWMLESILASMRAHKSTYFGEMASNGDAQTHAALHWVQASHWTQRQRLAELDSVN